MGPIAEIDELVNLGIFSSTGLIYYGEVCTNSMQLMQLQF